MSLSSKGGRLVYNSDNNPMKVDFIPDSDLYMNQMGRIGMCMAPGRYGISIYNSAHILNFYNQQKEEEEKSRLGS